MIKSALQYLMSFRKTEMIEIHNQKYSTDNLIHIKEPSPAALSITTLTGMVDYIKSQTDLRTVLPTGECEASENDKLLIQVVSPKGVRLYSPLKNDESRNCYIECSALTPDIRFNQFMDMESFNIMMQSCFAANDDQAAVLKIVGNIKEEQVKESGDDGISQTVTARVGIVKVADVTVPNPVTLRPYRTFTEVWQPASDFVFRMQNGPRAALYEADGGAWRQDAMRSIKTYLEEALAGYSVKVIS